MLLLLLISFQILDKREKDEKTRIDEGGGGDAELDRT